MLTTLLELCFAQEMVGANIDISNLGEADIVKVLFAENSGIIFQSSDEELPSILNAANVDFYDLGNAVRGENVTITNNGKTIEFNVAELRDVWYETSYLLDAKQTANNKAKERFVNYKNQPLKFTFPKHFTGASTPLSNRLF